MILLVELENNFKIAIHKLAVKTASDQYSKVGRMIH